MIDCIKKDPKIPLTIKMFKDFMREQNVNICKDDILVMKLRYLFRQLIKFLIQKEYFIISFNNIC